MKTFCALLFPSPTVRRLDLLVQRDRLVTLVETLPHSLIWVKACADLATTDRLLAHLAEAA